MNRLRKGTLLGAGVIAGVAIIAGTALAQESTNYDLSWNLPGGVAVSPARSISIPTLRSDSRSSVTRTRTAYASKRAFGLA